MKLTQRIQVIKILAHPSLPFAWTEVLEWTLFTYFSLHLISPGVTAPDQEGGWTDGKRSRKESLHVHTSGPGRWVCLRSGKGQ